MVVYDFILNAFKVDAYLIKPLDLEKFDATFLL